MIFCTILVLCGAWTASGAQLRNENTPAIIKASFIYNFAKLVDWPSKKSSGNFTIGILGDSDLYKQIVEKYSGKQIGSQSIEVVQLLSPDQMPSLHMLFISRASADVTARISGKLAKDHTMIITEDDGGLASGATLNFVVVDNQQKFEISETNAAAQQLTIGMTLKSLAHKLVK